MQQSRDATSEGLRAAAVLDADLSPFSSGIRISARCLQLRDLERARQHLRLFGSVAELGARDRWRRLPHCGTRQRIEPLFGETVLPSLVSIGLLIRLLRCGFRSGAADLSWRSVAARSQSRRRGQQCGHCAQRIR
jgi:hypothetical protein